jgi:hypothetical protein
MLVELVFSRPHAPETIELDSLHMSQAVLINPLLRHCVMFSTMEAPRKDVKSGPDRNFVYTKQRF